MSDQVAQLNSEQASSKQASVDVAVRSGHVRKNERPAKPLGTNGGCVSTGSTRDARPTAPIRTRNPHARRHHPVRQEKTPEELAQARIRQYKLQELAGDILPEERGLNACMRCRVEIASRVELVYAEGADGGNANFSHLQTCGSIWLCAPCAARESERRRKILQRTNTSFLEETGGSIWFSSYTVEHHDHNDLETLLENFLAARKLMKEGRQGMAMRNNFDIVGTISVLEITWSEHNGCHPHVHELIYCRVKDFDADGYEALARPAWKRAAAVYGMTMNKHGFDLKRTFGAVQDYVTKYGHAPASDRVWGTESEMVKGHLKRGRMNQHYTPFAMLDEILEVQKAMRTLHQELQGVTDEVRRVELREYLQELQGWQVKLQNVFREYAHAFKGHKQLNPSPGIRPWWKAAEEAIEKEEAEEAERAMAEQERYVLVEFYDDQWQEVVKRRIRGELREEGRTGRPGVILDYLATQGIEVFEEQYKRFEGWRVRTPEEGPATILSVRWCDILRRWRCSALLDAGERGQRWRAYDLVQLQVLAGPLPTVGDKGG